MPPIAYVAYVLYVLGATLIASLSAAVLSACPPASPRDGKKPDGGTDGDRYDVGGNDVGDFRCGGDSFICDGGIDASTDAGDVGGDGPIDSGIDGGAGFDGGVRDAGRDAGRDASVGGDEVCDAGIDGGVPHHDGGAGLDGGVRDGGANVDAGAHVDGGAKIDGGADGNDAGDGGVQVPGVNFHAASFSGPIPDLDSADAEIVAYGGHPASVYRCAVNGLDPAICSVNAELPAGNTPVSYHSTPFGYAIANVSPADDGKRIGIFKIDGSSSFADPTKAILGRKTLDSLTISSGGGQMVFALALPGGIVSYQSQDTPTECFFMAIGEAAYEGAAAGMALVFANFDGDWVNMQMPGLVKGLNTAAMGATTLNLGSGDKEYVVAVNAGKIDATDAFEAGIAVFDPEPSDIIRVKYCPVGEVELEPLDETVFDSTGRKLHLPVKAPQRENKLVDLETCAVEPGLPSGVEITGSIAEIVIDGNDAYIADSGGRVIFIDIPGQSVRGVLSLPDPPTACAMSGAFLYCAAGDELVAIDPSQVQLDR